jgi:SPP1 gp7 family putative phage head morphogenesis protein
MASVNEEIFDANVRHQIYLQRLSTSQVKEIIKIVEDVEVELANFLNSKELSNFSQTRLKSLLSEIRRINKGLYKNLENNLNNSLPELAEYEADFQYNLIKSALPIEINLTRPSIDLLKSLVTSKPMQGRFILDELKDLTKQKTVLIEKSLRLGLIEGETTPQIIRRIRGTKSLNYKDGVLYRSRSDIERLVRTSITHITSRARDSLFQANGDVIKSWRFVATLDNRTSKICISLDGTEHDVGKGPMPPRHPNCRSTSSPILKSWQELGLDLNEIPASKRPFVTEKLTGTVPDNVTYQDWLKRQNQGFVEDVLGKTKAKLFTDGKMGVDKFFDHSGKELTLKKLRKSEAKLFAKLQI